MGVRPSGCFHEETLAPSGRGGPRNMGGRQEPPESHFGACHEARL